jgi:hypothetical protein
MDCKTKDCYFKGRMKFLEEDIKRIEEFKNSMIEKNSCLNSRISITEKKNILLEVKLKKLLEKYCDNVKPFLCRVSGISKYYDRLSNVKTDYQYKAELRYEMNNSYDIKAVSVYWINPVNNEPVKIGFIPKSLNENDLFYNLDDLDVKIKFTGNDFLGGLLMIKQKLNFLTKDIGEMNESDLIINYIESDLKNGIREIKTKNENIDTNEFRDYSEYEEKRLELNKIIHEIISKAEYNERQNNELTVNFIEYKKEQPELFNVIREIIAETEIEESQKDNEIKVGIHYNGYYLATLFSYNKKIKAIKKEVEYIIENGKLYVNDRMKNISFDISMIGDDMDISDKSLNNDIISNYLDELFDHIRNYSSDIGIKLRRKKRLPKRKAG